MKECLRLLRVKHYVKNILICVPLFFAKDLFNWQQLLQAVLGIICFSLISSAVYILNDIQDVEKDRNHPKKRNRPIASGRISESRASFYLMICMIVAIILSIVLRNIGAFVVLAAYFSLNVAYSMGLKNKPIIDVVILASGFVLRIIYGGLLTGVEISKWLYMVVVTGSLYMGLGKRRNELKQQKDTREVLKYYTESFLDKNMYMFVTLVVVFYALWTMEAADSMLVWTVPIVIVILMKYSLNIEGDSDGDPVEVLLHDKLLIALTFLYAAAVFVLLYII